MFGYKLWCANVPLSYLSAFTLHKRSTHNANAKVTAYGLKPGTGFDIIYKLP